MMKNEMKSRKFCETDDYITMEYFLKREGFRLYDSHIPIIRRLITFGRSPNCTITLKSIRVSRMQCEIIYNDENIFLRDTQSSNGTFVNNEKVTNEMRKLEVGDYIGFGVNPFPKRYYETNQFVFSLQRYQSEQTVEIADDDNTDGSGKSSIENMDHTYNLDPVDNFTLKVTNHDDFTIQYEFDFSDDKVKLQSENQLKNLNFKYEKLGRDSLWNLFNDSDDTSDDEATRPCDYKSQFSVNSKIENSRLSVERSETIENDLCDLTKEIDISFENSKAFGTKARSFSENFNVTGKIPISSSKTRSFSTSTPKAGSIPRKLSQSKKEKESTLIELLQKPSKHEETKPQPKVKNLNDFKNIERKKTNLKNIVSNYERLGDKTTVQETKNSNCGNQNILTKSSSSVNIASKILQKPPKVEVFRRLSIDCGSKPRQISNYQSQKDFSNLASNLANITPRIIKKPLLKENLRSCSEEISKTYMNASNSGTAHDVSNIPIKSSPNIIQVYKSKFQNKKTETIISESLAQSSQKSKICLSSQPENSTAVDVYGTFEPDSENNKFVLNYYDNVTDNEDENETRNVEKISTLNVNKAKSHDQVQVIFVESNKLNAAEYIAIQQQPSTSDHISKILELESKKRPLTTFSYMPSDTCQVIPENKNFTKNFNRDEIKKTSNFDDTKIRFQKAIKSVMEMAVKTKSNQHRKTHVDMREVGSLESKQLQPQELVEKSVKVQPNNPNLSTELKKNEGSRSEMLRNLLLRSSTSVPSKEDELSNVKNSQNSYQIQSMLVGSTSYEKDSQIKQTKKVESQSSQKIQNFNRTSKLSNLKKSTQSIQQKSLKHVKHTSKPPRIRRTDAEINRDLELYSKMLESRSNKLKGTNVPPKIENIGKLIPKSQKLDTSVKLSTKKLTYDLKKLDTKLFDMSIQSKIVSEKSPDPSKEQSVSIKTKKLTSTDVVGIKEIFQKAVEEIKEKIIRTMDQDVAQEIEREISKVLNIVAVSDDDDEKFDEILDEKSGVFVKMEKKEETVNEKSLDNPMTNIITKNNMINVQPDLPVVSNLAPGVINFHKNSTIAANPIKVIPNLITAMPISLAATNISPRNVNETSSFTPKYTSPFPYHMVKTTVISSNNTNMSTFADPVVHTLGQYGHMQVDANYYQKPLNDHQIPKNLSQMPSSSYCQESTNSELHLYKSSKTNANFHQTQLTQGNTVQYPPDIIQTSQQNLRKTSLSFSDSQQFLNQYQQNLSESHQNLPNFISIPTTTNTNYISVPSYSTSPNQVLLLESDNQLNLSRKSIIVYPSHNSVQEPTEEVTILNLEPAKRTLSICNLLETSKQILMNNNAESDNSYVNEIFFPQNFVDVSHPNVKLSSDFSQNNLNADKSDFDQNSSKIVEVAKNDLMQSENLNDNSIQTDTNLEKNNECSSKKNDEELVGKSIIDGDVKNNNNNDVSNEGDLGYCEHDEAKIITEVKSMCVSQPTSVAHSLKSHEKITKNATANEIINPLPGKKQNKIGKPANVDRETCESRAEYSFENETKDNNKDKLKSENALNNISSDDNDYNNSLNVKQNELNALTSSVEVEEDIQIFYDNDSVISKPTIMENKIGELSEGLENSDDEKNKNTTSAPESGAETDLDQLEVSSFGSCNDQDDPLIHFDDFQENFKIPSEPLRSSRSKLIKNNVNSRSFQLSSLNPTVARRSTKNRKLSKKVVDGLAALKGISLKIKKIKDVISKGEDNGEKIKNIVENCEQNVEDQMNELNEKYFTNHSNFLNASKEINAINSPKCRRNASEINESSNDFNDDKAENSEPQSELTKKYENNSNERNIEANKSDKLLQKSVRSAKQTKISNNESGTKNKNQELSKKYLKSTRRSLRNRSNGKSYEHSAAEISLNEISSIKETLKALPDDQSEIPLTLPKPNESTYDAKQHESYSQDYLDEVNESVEMLTTPKPIKTSTPEKKERRLRSVGKISQNFSNSDDNEHPENLAVDFESEKDKIGPKFLESLLLDSLDILSNELLEKHQKFSKNSLRTQHNPSKTKQDSKKFQKSKSLEELSPQNNTEVRQKCKLISTEDNKAEIDKCIRENPVNRSKTRSSERLTKISREPTEPKILPKTKSHDLLVAKEPNKPENINKSKVHKSIISDESEEKVQTTFEEKLKDDKKFKDQNILKVPLNDTSQKISNKNILGQRILRSRSKSVDTAKESVETFKKKFSKPKCFQFLHKLDFKTTSEIIQKTTAGTNDDNLLKIDKKSSDEASLEQSKVSELNKCTESQRNTKQVFKENLIDDSIRHLRSRTIHVDSLLAGESTKNEKSQLSLSLLSTESVSKQRHKNSYFRSKSVEPSRKNDENDSDKISTILATPSKSLKEYKEEIGVRFLRNRVATQIQLAKSLKPTIGEKERTNVTKKSEILKLSETKSKLEIQIQPEIKKSSNQSKFIESHHLNSSNQTKITLTEYLTLPHSNSTQSLKVSPQPSKPSFSQVFLSKVGEKHENIHTTQETEELIVQRLRMRPKKPQNLNQSSIEPEIPNELEYTTTNFESTKQDHQDKIAQSIFENKNNQDSPEVKKIKNTDEVQEDEDRNKHGKDTPEAKKQRLENAITNKLLTINLTSLRSRTKCNDPPKSSESTKAKTHEELLSQKSLKDNPLIRRGLITPTSVNLELLKKLSIRIQGRPRKIENTIFSKPTQPVPSIREQILESQRRSRSIESSNRSDFKAPSENEVTEDKSAEILSKNKDQNKFSKSDLETAESEKLENIEVNQKVVDNKKSSNNLKISSSNRKSDKISTNTLDKMKSEESSSLDVTKHLTRYSKKNIEQEPKNKSNDSGKLEKATDFSLEKVDQTKFKEVKELKKNKTKNSTSYQKTISITPSKQTEDFKFLNKSQLKRHKNKTFDNITSAEDLIESVPKTKVEHELKKCSVVIQRLTPEELHKFTVKSKSQSILSRSNRSSMSSPERPLGRKISNSSEHIIDKRIFDLKSSSSRHSSTDSNSDIVPLINLIDPPRLRSFRESSVKTLLRQISDDKASSTENLPLKSTNSTRRSLFKHKDVKQIINTSKMLESSDDDCALLKYVKKLPTDLPTPEDAQRSTRSRSRTKTTSETEIISRVKQIIPEESRKASKILHTSSKISQKTNHNSKQNSNVNHIGQKLKSNSKLDVSSKDLLKTPETPKQNESKLAENVKINVQTINTLKDVEVAKIKKSDIKVLSDKLNPIASSDSHQNVTTEALNLLVESQHENKTLKETSENKKDLNKPKSIISRSESNASADKVMTLNKMTENLVKMSAKFEEFEIIEGHEHKQEDEPVRIYQSDTCSKSDDLVELQSLIKRQCDSNQSKYDEKYMQGSIQLPVLAHGIHTEIEGVPESELPTVSEKFENLQNVNESSVKSHIEISNETKENIQQSSSSLPIKTTKSSRRIPNLVKISPDLLPSSSSHNKSIEKSELSRNLRSSSSITYDNSNSFCKFSSDSNNVSSESHQSRSDINTSKSDNHQNMPEPQKSKTNVNVSSFSIKNNFETQKLSHDNKKSPSDYQTLSVKHMKSLDRRKGSICGRRRSINDRNYSKKISIDSKTSMSKSRRKSFSFDKSPYESGSAQITTSIAKSKYRSDAQKMKIDAQKFLSEGVNLLCRPSGLLSLSSKTIIKPKVLSFKSKVDTFDSIWVHKPTIKTSEDIVGKKWNLPRETVAQLSLAHSLSTLDAAIAITDQQFSHFNSNSQLNSTVSRQETQINNFMLNTILTESDPNLIENQSMYDSGLREKFSLLTSNEKDCATKSSLVASDFFKATTSPNFTQKSASSISFNQINPKNSALSTSVDSNSPEMTVPPISPLKLMSEASKLLSTSQQLLDNYEKPFLKQEIILIDQPSLSKSCGENSDILKKGSKEEDLSSDNFKTNLDDSIIKSDKPSEDKCQKICSEPKTSTNEHNKLIKNLPDFAMIKLDFNIFESKDEDARFSQNISASPKQQNTSFAHEDPRFDKEDLHIKHEILSNKTQDMKLVDIEIIYKDQSLPLDQEDVGDSQISHSDDRFYENIEMPGSRKLLSESRELNVHEKSDLNEHLQNIQTDEQNENSPSDSIQAQNSDIKSECSSLQTNLSEMTQESKPEILLVESVDVEAQTIEPKSYLKSEEVDKQQKDLENLVSEKHLEVIYLITEDSKELKNVKAHRANLRLENKKHSQENNKMEPENAQQESEDMKIINSLKMTSTSEDTQYTNVAVSPKKSKSAVLLAPKVIKTCQPVALKLSNKSSSSEDIHNLRSRLQKQLIIGHRSYSESSGLNKPSKRIKRLSLGSLKYSESDDSLSSESKTTSNPIKISSTSPKLPKNNALSISKLSQSTSSLSLSIEPTTYDNLQVYSEEDAKTPVPTHVYNNFNDKCTETIEKITQKWKEVDDLIQIEKEKITTGNEKNIENKSAIEESKGKEIKDRKEMSKDVKVDCFKEKTITTDSVGGENDKVVNTCLEGTDENKKVVVLSVETINMNPAKMDEILGRFEERPQEIDDESLQMGGELLITENNFGKINESFLRCPLKDLKKEDVQQRDQLAHFESTSTKRKFSVDESIIETIEKKSKSDTIFHNDEHVFEPTKIVQESIELPKFNQSIDEFAIHSNESSLINDQINVESKEPAEIDEYSQIKKVSNTSQIIVFHSQESEEFDNIDDDNDNLVIDIKETEETKPDVSTNNESNVTPKVFDLLVQPDLAEHDAKSQQIEEHLNENTKTESSTSQIAETDAIIATQKLTTPEPKPFKMFQYSALPPEPQRLVDLLKSTNSDLLSHQKFKKSTTNWMAIPTGPSSLRITKTSILNFKEGENVIKSRRNSTLPSDAPGTSKESKNSKELHKSFSLQGTMTPKDLKSGTSYTIKTRRSSNSQELGTSREIMVISRDLSHEKEQLIKLHKASYMQAPETIEKSSRTLKHPNPKVKHAMKVNKKPVLNVKRKDLHSSLKKQQSKSKTGIQSKVIANYTAMVRSLTKSALEPLSDEVKAQEKSLIREFSARSKEFIKSAKSLKKYINDPNYFEAGARCTRTEPVVTRLRSVSLDCRQVTTTDKIISHFPNREADWYRDSDFDSFDDDAETENNYDLKKVEILETKQTETQKSTLMTSCSSGPSPLTEPPQLPIGQSIQQPSVYTSPQRQTHSVQIIDSFGNIISSLDVYRQKLAENTIVRGLKKKFIFHDGSEVVMDDSGNMRKNSDPDVIIEIMDKIRPPEMVIDLDDIPDDPKPQSTKNNAQVEIGVANIKQSAKFIHPDGDLDHLLTDKLEVIPNQTQIASQNFLIQKSNLNTTNINKKSVLNLKAFPSSQNTSYLKDISASSVQSLQSQNSDNKLREQLLTLQHKFKSPQSKYISQSKDPEYNPIYGPSTVSKDVTGLLSKRNYELNEYYQRKNLAVCQTIKPKLTIDMRKNQNQLEIQSNIPQLDSKSMIKQLLLQKLRNWLINKQKIKQIQQSSIQKTAVLQEAPLIQTHPYDSSDDSEYENLPELKEIEDYLTGDELEFILAKRLKSQVNVQYVSQNHIQNLLSCDKLIERLDLLLAKISGTEKALHPSDVQKIYNVEGPLNIAEENHYTELESTLKESRKDQKNYVTENEEILPQADTLPISTGSLNLQELLTTKTTNIEEENREKIQDQVEQNLPQSSKNKIVIHPTYAAPQPTKSRKYSSNKKQAVRIFRVTGVNPVDNPQNPEVDQPSTKQHFIVVPAQNQVNVPQFLPIPIQNKNINQRLMQQPGQILDQPQFTIVSDQNEVSSQVEVSNQLQRSYTFIDHDNDVLVIENNPPQIFTSDGVQDILIHGSEDQIIQHRNSMNQQSAQNHYVLHGTSTMSQNNQLTQILSQQIQNETQKIKMSQNVGHFNQVVSKEYQRTNQNSKRVSQEFLMTNHNMDQEFLTNQILLQRLQKNKLSTQLSPCSIQDKEINNKDIKNIQNITNIKAPSLKVLSCENINQKKDLYHKKLQSYNTPNVSVPEKQLLDINLQSANDASSKINQIYKLSTSAAITVPMVQIPSINTHQQSMNISNILPTTLQPPDTISFTHSLQAIAHKVQNKKILDLASLKGKEMEEVIVLDDDDEASCTTEEIIYENQSSLLSEEAEIARMLTSISNEQQLTLTPPIIPINNKMIPSLTPMQDEITVPMQSDKNIQILSHDILSKNQKSQINLIKLDQKVRKVHKINELKILENVKDAPVINLDLSGVLNDLTQVEVETAPVKRKRGRPPTKRGVEKSVQIKRAYRKSKKSEQKLGVSFATDTQQSKLLKIDNDAPQKVQLIEKAKTTNNLENKYEIDNQKSYHKYEPPTLNLIPQPTPIENIKNEAEVLIHSNPLVERSLKNLPTDESIDITKQDPSYALGTRSEPDSLTETEDKQQISKIDIVQYSESDCYVESDMQRVPITARKSNILVGPKSAKKGDQFEEADQYSKEDQLYSVDQFSTAEDQDIFSSLEQYQDYDKGNLSESEDITPFYPVFPEASVVLERLTDEEIALAMSSIKRLESSSIYQNFANTYSDILDSKGISEKRAQDATKFKKRHRNSDEEESVPKRPNIATKSTFSSSAVKTNLNVENRNQNKRKIESSSEDSDNSTSQLKKRHRLGPQSFYEDPDYSPAGTSKMNPESHAADENVHQIIRPCDLDKFCHRDSDSEEDDDEEMENYGSDAYETRIPTVSRMSQRHYRNFLSTIRTNETDESSNQIFIEDLNDENDDDAYSKSDDERIMEMPVINEKKLIAKDKSILSKKSKKSEKRKVSFYNSVFVRTFLSEDE